MKLGSRQWKTLLGDGAAQLGVPLQAAMLDQFAGYAAELTVWNRRINLTAITTPEEIAIKHFLDSLAVLTILPPTGTLLDVGTGGGFPGLPLKIAVPDLKVTLLDASRKKINFSKHVIRVLGLEGVAALQLRIEDLPRREKFRGHFDVIVCRAFSSLRDFVVQAEAVLAPQGLMVAFKGRRFGRELKALEAYQGPGGANGPVQPAGTPNFDIQVVPYTLPVLALKRALVIVRPGQSHR